MRDEIHPPRKEGEEPPFVQGLLMTATARVEDGVRRFLGSIDLRIRLFLWGACSLVIFLVIVSLSVIQSPDLGGIAGGIVGGFVCALVFAAAFGWLLLWSNSVRSGKRADGVTSPLDTLLAPTLRELNTVRADVIRSVRKKSFTRVPLGIAGALTLWVLGQWTDDPPDIVALIILLIVGAVAGEIWAARKLEREYRRLYKDRVLPKLAARFGDLTYRQANGEDVRRLQAQRIFPGLAGVDADDAIVGTHHGLAIDIVEARLKKGSGDKQHVVFDGLLIGLTLPRSLTGTTVVVTDQGVFGNLKAAWRSGSMEPVRLEDPRFEGRYEVYSTNQIEARALLTPAFMERFMALGARSGFSLPGAMAEGNRLMVALPKSLGTGDLFEPPVYWKPAGGQALIALEQDIRAVLSMADTVIDLDFWAAGWKRDNTGQTRRSE